MKAFIVDRYKKKGALRLGEMPEPALRDDDVLVEIYASGLNLLDSKIRDGELGHDVARTVVRAGSRVRQFKPGDEIYARAGDGRIGTFGGKLISISGPPDLDFAKEQGLNWLLQQVMRLLSFGIRRKAKGRQVSYSFLFMRANGEQLSQITSLIEAGFIRPVIDRVFPFESTE